MKHDFFRGPRRSPMYYNTILSQMSDVRLTSSDKSK